MVDVRAGGVRSSSCGSSATKAILQQRNGGAEAYENGGIQNGGGG
jgi:hypothetical protein